MLLTWVERNERAPQAVRLVEELIEALLNLGLKSIDQLTQAFPDSWWTDDPTYRGETLLPAWQLWGPPRGTSARRS